MASSLERLDSLVEHSLNLRHRRGTKRLTNQAQRRWLVALLVIADVATLGLAFAAAYVVRFNLGLGVFEYDFAPWSALYSQLGPVLVLGWIVLFWAFGLYDWDNLLGGTREYAAVFQATVSGTILLALGEFLVPQFIIARGWVGLSWLFAFGFVTVERFAIRRLAYTARRHGYLMSPTLIVGAGDEARLLGEQLLNWPTSGLNVLGFLADDVRPGQRICRNLYTLGPLERLGELVEAYQVEELLLATGGLSRETILHIFEMYGTSPHVHLRLSSGLFELLTTGLNLKELAYVPLIGVNRVRLSRTDAILKTLVEFSLTIMALIFFSPIILLIVVLIKLDSPGPVFYRRRVMGLNGRQFDALKFRTMHIDGDAILAANPALLDVLANTHKIKGDPRVTRVGFYLRRFSLDEVPQLINVLKRDMSLVGPRIISPPELKQYGQWALNLLTVRPGLTGLWQVSGRSDVSYEERVRLDMFYIRNYSIWLDLQLIVQTIPVVLSGRDTPFSPRLL
jgi:exopolysaccharide biosynthesis polyprenyl glycosylphosphotransferase